jgi:endoglucanase
MTKRALLLLSVFVLSCGPGIVGEDQTADETADTADSLRRATRLSITKALTLSTTSVVRGTTLTASVTYKNSGRVPFAINKMSIESRPPGGSHSYGPYASLVPALGPTTIQPGSSVTVTATRAFTTADPQGRWEAYSTFQRADGSWVDGPSVYFAVTSTTTPTPDAGTPPRDAGTPPTPDAGTPPRDAGTPPTPDAGIPPRDAGTPPTPDAGTPAAGGVFTVMGNHIKNPNGTNFHGRGANLLDTRFCGVCGSASGGADTEVTRRAEVIRRMDDLVDNWHVNFIRIDLETMSPGFTHTAGVPAADGVVNSPAYLQSIREIVDHAATKPGLLLMLSIWSMSSMDANGWPTAATNAELAVLATTFKDSPRVMFGVTNEPENNYDGALNAQAWARMNSAVQAVRDAEVAANATVQHLVAVQGLGGWARHLGYYTNHPITAGGGVNIVYEIHVYDPASQFASMYETYSATLPIIIGEFGPVSGAMTTADTAALMISAEAREIPYLAWQYGMGCGPDLLVDHNNQNACGVATTLTPTAWGAQLKNRLAVPW